jgi:ligand-binding SRPBCC domain-containing protein
MRWRGMPFHWTSLLTHWKRNEFFTYEQENGPYSHFRHEHRFQTAGTDTEILDRVALETRAGCKITRWVAVADLRRIFKYREQKARHLLQPSKPLHVKFEGANRMP